MIPSSLLPVALLYLSGGLIAGIDLLRGAGRPQIKVTEWETHGVSLVPSAHFFFHAGLLGTILCLGIGLGLLYQRRGWRSFAMILLVLGLFVLPSLAMLILVSHGPLTISYYGKPDTAISKTIATSVVIALWGLNWWTYRVLTRDDVRNWFGVGRS